MTSGRRWIACVAAMAGIAALAGCATQAPQNPMSFFVTSANPGKGADLGGLAGADQYCKALASAVGAGDKNWRAYLSTDTSGGTSAVDARDRIGKGPWRNVRGVVIANSVDELHGSNNLTKLTALTEKGEVINGRGDTPNLHDMLTGSTPDGRVATGDKNLTCGNWTSGAEGSAVVGHHDRTGLDEQPPAKSWNSSHPSRGCSLEALKTTGGGGLYYCFAAN